MIPGQQERANSATVPNPGNYMLKFLLGREYCNKLRASRVEAALQKLETSPHRGKSDTETDSPRRLCNLYPWIHCKNQLSQLM